jgi:hypothetical protein
VALEDMTPYDRNAWEGTERWRAARLSAPARHIVPKKARNGVAKVKDSALARFGDLPVSDQFVETFYKALDGALWVVRASADASLRRSAVVKAYVKRGHDVSDLEGIRALELRDVDKTKPKLSLIYTGVTTAEGAAAGLVVSGGEIVASGGTVFGAGAGAAPGAGLVIATMAVDAATVLVASMRAIAHTAAYYGYDTGLPEEQMFAAGVLGFGLAEQAGKAAAYIELNKVVQGLVRRELWEPLNKLAASKVMRVVYLRLGMRLTQRKLGQSIPVLGIVVGAGANAWLLGRLTQDADYLYRERFLCDKYGLSADLPLTPATASGGDTIPVMQLVSDQLGNPDTDGDPGDRSDG